MPTQRRGVFEFLEDLATDPDIEKRFDAEPLKIMTEYELTEHQQLLILGGTLAEIRDMIQAAKIDEADRLTVLESASTDPYVIMIKMR